MTIKQRAKQSGVELPLVISDHADWNELTETITATGAETIWVTHGREDVLSTGAASAACRQNRCIFRGGMRTAANESLR